MIIKSHNALTAQYDQLGPGDIFIGPLINRRLIPTQLIDLLERGVRCFPSPLSRTLSGSKAAQAVLLNAWMVPHTRVITRRAELVEAVQYYHENRIQQVVTKEDRMHCGHGLRKWESIETLYSFSAFSKDAYPFVLQPYLDAFIDIRVVVAGDLLDAYARENENNFRKNLSLGGKSRPYVMTAEVERFCATIMARGRFPYAHMDLLIAPDGSTYLSEIALNGGLKWSAISRQQLEEKKKEILEGLVKDSPA